LLRRREEENPFDYVEERPEGEVPPGFRLRRVGTSEWVAEPVRWFWGALILLAMGFLFGGLTGALMARAYYHRRATPLVLSVNGAPLRQDELRTRLERLYGPREVEAVARYELLRQFASARGCWPTEEEVAKRFQKERQKPDYLERLAIQGVSEDVFREELTLDMAQARLLTRGITVTPAEVWDFYQRNADPANPAARYYTPERVQVTAVGTASEEAARQCLRDLRNGLSWKEAVARYSEHESRRADGLMPPFARGESVFATNPRTEAAIFAMSPGDRLGPVEAGRKWWVLRCENKWGAHREPWEEAKEDARMGAMVAKGIVLNGAKLAAEEQEFVKRATIIISDPAYGTAQEVVLTRPVRW